MKKIYYAIFTLTSAIIGAGIFSLPYVAMKAGILVMAGYLVLLSAVIMMLHLLYGEVVLRTGGNHRFVGYSEIYLGIWGKRISTFSIIVGTYATLLIYIILGGEFLTIIFGKLLSGSPFSWSIVFFLFSVIFIARGLKVVSKIELFLSSFLITAILFFLTKGIFSINFSNYGAVMDLREIFLPYGVLLFALGGFSVIPDITEILGKNKTQLKKAILAGTLIPAVVYFLFFTVILGVSGSKTSQEAISGLAPFYGTNIMIFGALIGFLAVATSFLAYGINLKKTFEYDYKVSGIWSFILALAIPFLIFLSGFDNFIRVIGFSGAVMGGIDGVLIILMYQKADRGGAGTRKPEYDIITSKWLEYLLIAVFVLGIIYAVLNP